MSRSDFNAAPDMTSDATFRTLITAFHNAILAIGWVQSADTGQINLTTVTRPGTINTSAGYLMYKMADALAGSYPVLLKIEWGTGSAITVPNMWVTGGFTTDGAGTFTGNATARTAMTFTVGSTTVYYGWVAGDSGRLHLIYGYDVTYATLGSANTARIINVERTLDTGGAGTTDGAEFVFHRSTVPYFHDVVRSGVLVSAATAISNFPMNAPPTSWSVGPDVGVDTCCMFGTSGRRNPLTGFMAYVNSDIAVGGDYPVTLYGVSHTYRATGSSGTIGANTASSSSPVCSYLFRRD